MAAKKPNIEPQSIYATKAIVQSACQKWSRLSRRAKLRLARRIATDQQDVLKQEYSDLLAVSYGFRAVGRTLAARKVCYDEPVVGLLVKNKRKARNNAERFRHLPKLILTQTRIGRRVVTVAVPTDVESARLIVRSTKANGARVRVSADGKNALGMLTCVVSVPGRPEEKFGLSCLHVLGLTSAFGSSSPGTISVSEFSTGTVVGTTSALRGRLRPGPGFNFDAALAKLSSDPLVVGCLKPHVTERVVASLAHPEELVGRSFVVHGKLGREIEVKFTKRWGTFPIQYDGLGTVYVRGVVQCEVLSGGPTVCGDSGATVLASRGREFVGMHIAGDGTLAYMLAAPDVLDATNYGPFLVGEELRLLTAF